MSSEELNNLSNIEDYLTYSTKKRTIRLKQCSIRQSTNRPRYYRLRKFKPIVQRFQIHSEKNTSKFDILNQIIVVYDPKIVHNNLNCLFLIINFKIGIGLLYYRYVL